VAERLYERSALILDSEEGVLAQLSNSLTVLGHDPIYSEDVDELIRLARERAGRASALVLPAAHACDWWPVIRKDVAVPLGIAPRSVLPVGARLADPDAQALHSDGLRWALAEPFTPWELRFAVSVVLSMSDTDDLRLETRIPCSIAVEVASQSRAVPAELTDLSTGGAFVALAHPHPEGTPVVLRGALCKRPVSLHARVAWRTDTHTSGWRDRGMGVAFERLELGTLDLLRQEVDRALDRFRIRARAMDR
jgi:hypothetical protein